MPFPELVLYFRGRPPGKGLLLMSLRGSTGPDPLWRTGDLGATFFAGAFFGCEPLFAGDFFAGIFIWRYIWFFFWKGC